MTCMQTYGACHCVHAVKGFRVSLICKLCCKRPTPHSHHRGMCRSERSDCKRTATALSASSRSWSKDLACNTVLNCDLDHRYYMVSMLGLRQKAALSFKLNAKFFRLPFDRRRPRGLFCRWRSFNVQEKSTKMVSWETYCQPVSDLRKSSEGSFVFFMITLSLHSTQAAHKSFKVKRFLAKKASQNRPIPQWFRQRTNNKIRWELEMFTVVGGDAATVLSWMGVEGGGWGGREVSGFE